MSSIIALLGSVMFVGGLIIVSRTFSLRSQLIVGIVMMVLAIVLQLK